MSTQKIVERILSDAEAEAKVLIEKAEEKAAKLQADASLYAENEQKSAKDEAAKKRETILEKRKADARLDGAKLFLSEKRKVVNAVYDEALSRLMELDKESSLKLIESLLKSYAEQGDELYFARNFAYKKEAVLLPVITEKNLIVAEESMDLDGGVYLKGKTSDKDLSFGALLAADREAYQAELAKELFQ